MTSKEVDALARKRTPLPDEAGLCDMMLYHILTAIYGEYREGIISADIAKIEKARAMEKHRELELWERIYKQQDKRTLELEVIAREAQKEHKCPLCVKMYDILCGYKRKEENEDTKNDT